MPHDTSNRPPEFEARQHGEEGHTTIYRTDNETDFIRHHVESLIRDSALTEYITARVTRSGDGWTRVEVASTPDVGVEDLDEIGAHLDATFKDRGWYDCREFGYNDSSTAAWYVVKHNHGPWM